MPLPTSIDSPAAYKNALQYYAEQHSGIDHFAYGKYNNLTDKLKDVARGEYLLFVPWPSMDPRNSGGNFDYRYVSNITVITPLEKNNQTNEEAALVEAGQIITDLLVRMRSDASDNGWEFSINDIRQIDPVLDTMNSNPVGYQLLLYFGEARSVVPNSAVWDDLA